MEKQCLYTAQGEFVCTSKTVEGFVAEQPNMSMNSTGSIANNQNIIGSAIQQKYCEINMQTDQTGKTTYTLKKECKK